MAAAYTSRSRNRGQILALPLHAQWEGARHGPRPGSGREPRPRARLGRRVPPATAGGRGSDRGQQGAEAYFAAHKPGWRSAKHARQWTSTLKAYAYPVFGALPVQQIDVALVMRMLEPIWTAKTVTAGRVRGRVEVILDWAATRGYRRGENPARWKGHLENLLPKRSKVSKVKHHPALPYREIGTFMAALRTEEGAAAQALEFTILTAARTSEVTGARRGELASEAKIWTVPEGRTKGEKEQRVPLSPPASAIAKRMLKFDETGL